MTFTKQVMSFMFVHLILCMSCDHISGLPFSVEATYSVVGHSVANCFSYRPALLWESWLLSAGICPCPFTAVLGGTSLFAYFFIYQFLFICSFVIFYDKYVVVFVNRMTSFQRQKL